ncbi:MAG: hypothetical protein H6807_04900 [Planctomycetes bacterium]|nr:hypothetical protein [Planctomycetota bacterium]
MITINATGKPKAGGQFCVTVEGYIGDLDVVVEAGSMALPKTISYSGGVATVCFSLPDKAVGKLLTVSVSDAKNREQSWSRWIK